MSERLVMAVVEAGGTVEDEPVVVVDDGDLVALTLDDGAVVTFDRADLLGALGVREREEKAA